MCSVNDCCSTFTPHGGDIVCCLQEQCWAMITSLYAQLWENIHTLIAAFTDEQFPPHICFRPLKLVHRIKQYDGCQQSQWHICKSNQHSSVWRPTIRRSAVKPRCLVNSTARSEHSILQNNCVWMYICLFDFCHARMLMLMSREIIYHQTDTHTFSDFHNSTFISYSVSNWLSSACRHVLVLHYYY